MEFTLTAGIQAKGDRLMTPTGAKRGWSFCLRRRMEVRTMAAMWTRSMAIVASLMLFSVWAFGIPSPSVGAGDRTATPSHKESGAEAAKKQPSHSEQQMETKGSKKHRKSTRNKMMEITRIQDEKSAVSF